MGPMTHNTPLFRRASLGTLLPNAGQPAPSAGASMHQAALPCGQALTMWHTAIAPAPPVE